MLYFTSVLAENDLVISSIFYMLLIHQILLSHTIRVSHYTSPKLNSANPNSRISHAFTKTHKDKSTHIWASQKHPSKLKMSLRRLNSVQTETYCKATTNGRLINRARFRPPPCPLHSLAVNFR